jgi:prepilin-type processing-associated H-X9-DG protein
MYGFNLGSAHSAGFNSAFADGSVKMLRFGIDLETMNQLAHRSDGSITSWDAL